MLRVFASASAAFLHLSGRISGVADPHGQDVASAPRRPPVKVLLLMAASTERWRAAAPPGERPGDLPYSVERLISQPDIAGTIDSRALPRLIKSLTSRIERRFPNLRGLQRVLANIGRMRQFDTVFTIFEDQALATASLKPLLARKAKLVVLTCWLAEDVQHMSRAELRRTRRAAQQVTHFLVYSTNQIEILEHYLRVPKTRVSAIPFGVDEIFYQPTHSIEVGDYFLSVGRDKSRDFNTLVEAARLSRVRVMIVSPLLPPTDLPVNVEWIQRNVSHVEYRTLVQQARAIVVPTLALAYPGGQTAVLEAMAMSKAVITTASAAMAEYVRHNEDGVLVPPSDAGSLAAAMTRLNADTEARQLLGERARETFSTRFTTEKMWAGVRQVLQVSDTSAKQILKND